MPFNIGWVELTLILVIVTMLFGVGKLPEVFGAVGKGIKEFRKEAGTENKAANAVKTEPPAETSTEAQ
ncbi:MAG: twin-arginine translocase TatA/TatE family subunit [Chloroflexi bacterium]|nr:MAG: twin-arginine translocase TatA/TatE family subunit [Chloroflexota bacterium]